MKTDDLIARLAAETGPVAPFAIERKIALYLLVGSAAGLTVVLTLLGLRPDLHTAVATSAFWIKFAFTAGLGALGVVATCRLARPGADAGLLVWIGMAVLLIGVSLAGAIEVLTASAGDRAALWLGVSWRTCPWWILAVSIPILIVVLAVMRSFAPTRPAVAGLALGLASGGVGATLYGLHCQEATLSFLATWYVLGVVAVGGVGAILGSRALRW